MLLLDKLEDPAARLWCAARAVESGWSRKLLDAQFASDLKARQGGALTSFGRSLSTPDSELARDATKDPYNFEFLNLSAEAKERDLELARLNDIQSFLMEMGRGFAIVGRQFLLRVAVEETGEEQEFFIDLLLYNYILRRFVVIDLKIEDFKPESISPPPPPPTSSSASRTTIPRLDSCCAPVAAGPGPNGRCAAERCTNAITHYR